MKIAIIGTGNVGSALAQRFVQSGHQVSFGVRDASSPKSQKASTIAGTTLLSIEEASKLAEVIIIATPPEAVLSLVAQLGDVKNKIIIDTTNSIRTRPEPYATAYHALKEITKSNKIVKCFNSTGFENMNNPIYSDFGGIDMFCAGDNKEAKALAQNLAKQIGFSECWDFGGDDKVELLEKFALSWINLAIMQGHGRNLAFKVIKRA
ncbi:MAG: NAD(P)-binding domain-containing protein [Cyclobacteriaceae bacterium]|nr:NAD(P)-binding domain-containing protein [Cyclobacteriaceae bacterium]